jgi:hypothetical protein
MKRYKLVLAEDTLNVILESLGDQPFKKVHSVIAELYRQANPPPKPVKTVNPVDPLKDKPKKSSRKE